MTSNLAWPMAILVVFVQVVVIAAMNIFEPPLSVVIAGLALTLNLGAVILSTKRDWRRAQSE